MDEKKDELRSKLFYEQKNGYDLIDTEERLAVEDYCRGYMDYLNASRMEREAVANAIRHGKATKLRIESKRLLAYECLRQMGQLPTVYMQAVAGGTSPLALEKGFRDLKQCGMVAPDAALPRMLLVQQDECDPMVTAWEKATAAGFPDGWEQQYEAKKDINTRIGILTAANPGNYPLVAPLVRRSGGTFLRVKEAELPHYGKEMKSSRSTLMGPASVVCYAGFFQAVDNGLIKSGDTVLLNTGEGSDRAQWFKDLVEE